MNGHHHFQVLSSSHSREHLLEHAKRNGVHWQVHSHEGVNWLRACNAIVGHINSGKDFDTDGADLATAKKMLFHYKELRESHKKTMVPHIRSAMTKLSADGHSREIDDLLQAAHDHLSSNGGPVWAEKVRALTDFNHRIAHLTEKIDKLGKIRKN